MSAVHNKASMAGRTQAHMGAQAVLEMGTIALGWSDWVRVRHGPV
jgi:hypothetical protein